MAADCVGSDESGTAGPTDAEGSSGSDDGRFIDDCHIDHAMSPAPTMARSTATRQGVRHRRRGTRTEASCSSSSRAEKSRSVPGSSNKGELGLPPAIREVKRCRAAWAAASGDASRFRRGIQRAYCRQSDDCRGQRRYVDKRDESVRRRAALPHNDRQNAQARMRSQYSRKGTDLGRRARGTFLIEPCSQGFGLHLIAKVVNCQALLPSRT